LLIISLLACSVSSENRDRRNASGPEAFGINAPHDLESILKKGKLTVLTLSSTNSYFLYRGEPMGFEFELLNSYAKQLGVSLEVIIAKDINSLFDPLLLGEVDIVAANLTVTQDRATLVSFTEPYLLSKQVLVQRKPDNYNNLSYARQQSAILRNPIDLIDREIYVHKNSSFYSRLISLSDEIGGRIILTEVPGDIDPEMLIRLVAEGHIDYTIADEHIARLNKGYYPNLDVSMAISFPQKIAWACHKDAPELLQSINEWLLKAQKNALIAVLYNKYFNSVKDQYERKNSEFSTISGNKISPYDPLIKKYSAMLGWDWRLVAAQMAQESRFNANARSWAGAFGLMQLMPQTARQFGVDSTSGPEEQIKAGIKYMMWLNTYWENIIHDDEERIKFVLASYNVGLGHVIDARNLTDCYGGDSSKWDNHVNYFLKNKSSSEFLESEWVKYGYCRCEEPVDYVDKILTRFAHYQKLIL
jgi:membrane-bound lytic murein transglycosylase F